MQPGTKGLGHWAATSWYRAVLSRRLAPEDVAALLAEVKGQSRADELEETES